MLLPSQAAMMERLFQNRVFPIVVLRGDRQSGKRTVVREYLSRLQGTHHEYNLVDEATKLSQRRAITASDFLQSLASLRRTPPDVVFFPRIDKIFTVLADYHAENRNLA